MHHDKQVELLLVISQMVDNVLQVLKPFFELPGTVLVEVSAGAAGQAGGEGKDAGGVDFSMTTSCFTYSEKTRKNVI